MEELTVVEMHSLKMRTTLVLYTLLSSNIYSADCKKDLKDLYLMGFTSANSSIWQRGGALIPAFNMAVKDVNSRADILADYRLNLLMRDTKCDPGLATDEMYKLLYTAPVKHMILGPICSIEAEVQARAVHYWNISHISNGATSPVLSDRKKYPTFFRINPSDIWFNPVRIAIFEKFGWKKIGTINVAEEMFSSVLDDLVIRLNSTDIKIESQEIFEQGPLLRVKNLKDKDVRIIIALSYENQARQILCAAYKEKLYGPKIVWFFLGWYTDHWWRTYLSDVSCTAEQMSEAMEGNFLTSKYHQNQNQERGIANLTVEEFKEKYTIETTGKPEIKGHDKLIFPSYDVVWAGALALDCADKIMKENGFDKTLGDFSYTDVDIADLILDCIYSTSFLGLSGNVQFDKSGEALRNIRIEQIQGSERVTVGRYILEEEDRRLVLNESKLVWKGGNVPRDSTEIQLVQKTIPQNLYIVMATLSTAGIILTICLGMFNVYNRNHYYVKMSSPNINNILLLGCGLTYTSVFMTSYKEQTAGLCKLKHFTFSIGFTVAFGAMFTKTWRVYRIFCNKQLLRVKIMDSHLMIMVLVMVGIVTIFLTFWEIFDPFYIRTLYLKHEEYTTDDDIMIRPYLRDCMSKEYYYFMLAFCIAEGLFLAFGAFLAFETRKVKIEALNDSRLIGMCLYNVIILSVLGLTLSLLLDHKVALVYGVTSGCLILGTTTTQLIVFVPKIRSVLYPKPEQASSSTQRSFDTEL